MKKVFLDKMIQLLTKGIPAGLASFIASGFFRRSTALALGGILLLLLAFFGFWIQQLNTQIQVGLKNKNFLPPTEIYGAAVVIHPQTDPIDKLLNHFSQKNYQFQENSSRLLPGEWTQTNPSMCKEILAKNWSMDGGDIQLMDFTQLSSCHIYQVAKTQDPLFQNIGLQMVVSQDSLVKMTFRQHLLPSTGTPSWSLTKDALLEPDLLIQALQGEPIQQKFTKLGSIPTNCLRAVLAIEDRNFLEHQGISWLGLARAFWVNVIGGRPSQGGSTITQQLVKNFFLNPEKTFRRKWREFWMATLLELHATKDDILETYLNLIYMGQNGAFQVRGFPAASQFYYSKSIENLSLGECASLAAILNSPGLYDPFKHPDRTMKRRGLVLNNMYNFGWISPQELSQAKAEPVQGPLPKSLQESFPYYVDFVIKEMRALGKDPSGASIFTHLQPKIQLAAQRSVVSQIQRLEKDDKKTSAALAAGKNLEAAVLVANNESAGITAVVGGRNFRTSPFNRAFDSARQIGSLMKPLVYIEAFLKKQNKDGKMFLADSIILDETFTHKWSNQSWTPENYGKKTFGPVPLYFALSQSLNVSTAKLALELGLDDLIQVARKFHVQAPLGAAPSLSLGAFEIPLREVLSIYTCMARMGSCLQPTTIRSMILSSGEAFLPQRTSPEVDSEWANAVAQVVAMLKQTMITGTAQSAKALGWKGVAAGKTGTTSDFRDSWFAGFTPDYTAVSWLGYDDNTSTALTGGRGALPIWIEIMTPFMSEKDFPWPETLELRKIPFHSDPNQTVELLFPKEP